MDLLHNSVFRINRFLNRWLQKRSLGKVDPGVFRYTDCLATVLTMNQHYKAKHLCDIGAHKGHWSFVMQQLNRDLEEVVMFEPQQGLVELLQDLDLNTVQKHIFPYALGDERGKKMLTGATASASILNTASNQQTYFPGSVRAAQEEVSVARLDEIYAKHHLHYPDVVKLDVQGYELNVLKGGRSVLSKARYLVIELSFCEFYQGQPPLSEILHFLEAEHYILVDYGHELRATQAPHCLLQVDAVFQNARFA